MTDAPDDPSPPAAPDRPRDPAGASPRPEIAGERPYQKLRRLEREGNVARWNFFGSLRASTRSETVATVLLAANCAVFAAMVTWGVSAFEPSLEDLLRWGALRPLLTRDGQPWRLLTACFLHIGLIHLAVNMYSLWSLRFVETWFGHLAFAVLYLVSGLCGSLASTAFSDPFVVGAGASGAIFGVFGAVLGAVLRWKRLGVDSRVTGPILKGVYSTLLLNAVIALSIRNLDHFAHAGGFASGIVLGYLLAHAPTPEGVAGRRRRGWTVAAVSCIVLVGLVVALERPGLADAGRRAEGEQGRDVELMEKEIQVASSLPVIPAPLVPEARKSWVPYLTDRVRELREISAAFPGLRPHIAAQLRWYEGALDRLNAALARTSAGRPR